jgi:hypothetical protein
MEVVTVNAAGLVQGIALVTFPAASVIFTSPTGYDLSSSQYGTMFVPQVVTAITVSLLGAGLLWPGFTRRASEKRIYLTGLFADLAAMVLLILSWGVARQHAAAYALLLVATGCLGVRRWPADQRRHPAPRHLRGGRRAVGRHGRPVASGRERPPVAGLPASAAGPAPPAHRT